MKRLLSIFLLAALLAAPVAAHGAAPSDIVSTYAVLMDADTGQVLYNKGMDERVYPASTTKVLTALVVLENAKLYEVVTVQQSAVDDITWDNSHIALTEGEQFTVESGLYALMLPSANDAANALAEHVAGSQAKFADMMNQKAEEIGAISSHFTNAHGLHDNNHYTTAYDMALITRYAMNNDRFRDIFGTARYTMPATNKNDERPFTNYQYHLVRETGFYNPEVIGGKVGFTTEAQNTMTTVGRRGDRTLICAVMHSPIRDDKFADTDKLLEFGFSEFVPYYMPREQYSGFTAPIQEEGVVVGSARFTTGQDFSALLHSSIDPQSVTVNYVRPNIFDTSTDIACAVTFDLPDTPDYLPATLGRIELTADISLPVLAAMAQPDQTGEAPGIVKTAGIVVGVILVVLLLFVAWRRHQIKKRRKARQRRLAQKQKEAEHRSSPDHRPPPSRTTRTRSGYAPRAGAE